MQRGGRPTSVRDVDLQLRDLHRVRINEVEQYPLLLYGRLLQVICQLGHYHRSQSAHSAERQPLISCRAIENR